MHFKNLDRYRTGGIGSRMQLSFPVRRTLDGRAYRYSPNKDVHPQHFVLGDTVAPAATDAHILARMRHNLGTPRNICTYSGTIGEDEWFPHP